MSTQNNNTASFSDQMDLYEDYSKKTLIQYKIVLSKLSNLYLKYDIPLSERIELHVDISKLVNMEHGAAAMLIKSIYNIG